MAKNGDVSEVGLRHEVAVELCRRIADRNHRDFPLIL